MNMDRKSLTVREDFRGLARYRARPKHLTF
jgi:hypothetical protein